MTLQEAQSPLQENSNCQGCIENSKGCGLVIGYSVLLEELGEQVEQYKNLISTFSHITCPSPTVISILPYLALHEFKPPTS